MITEMLDRFFKAPDMPKPERHKVVAFGAGQLRKALEDGIGYCKRLEQVTGCRPEDLTSSEIEPFIEDVRRLRLKLTEHAFLMQKHISALTFERVEAEEKAKAERREEKINDEQQHKDTERSEENPH